MSLPEVSAQYADALALSGMNGLPWVSPEGANSLEKALTFLIPLPTSVPDGVRKDLAILAPAMEVLNYFPQKLWRRLS